MRGALADGRGLFGRSGLRWGQSPAPAQATLHSISLWERFADLIGLNRVFLREGKIQIDDREDVLISPIDGKVQHIAPIGSDGVIQEKSLFGRFRFVTLRDHLRDSPHLESFAGGHYVNLYLAPWNLHYILFPAAGRMVETRYIPGACYPLVVCRTGDVRNEKLFAIVETDWGFPIAMILVGSFAVCGIRLDAPLGVGCRKGDRLGCFKLGSTVVMIFPPDRVEILAREKQRIRLGDSLARVLRP